MTTKRIRDVLRDAARVMRRILGAPDYEAYLAHLRECHPDVAPVTRQEFERARLDDRYSRPGQRCC